jgi:hypothetical protein
MAVTKSHSLSVGIVGLPNAGKSTIFNALTKMSVPAENFPFCTIDKNVGMVEIPDERLKKLAELYNAKEIIPSVMKFVDIAGLVKGASKGEGLGNQFLSHIREVDVIMYILRAFESDEIVHVYNRVDPVDDFDIVQSELILKDIETVEKKLQTVEKEARINKENDIQMQKEVLNRIINGLNDNIPVIEMEFDEDEKGFVQELFLLTNKKRMFILNTKEEQNTEKLDGWKKRIGELTNDIECKYIVCADVKLINDMAGLKEGEKKEFLEMFEKKPSDIEDIIKIAYDRLNLLTFYTGSEKEVNAWTIERGATVKEAAGVIHTDLEKSFISADVVPLDVMMEEGGWQKAREKGLVRNHSRDYLVNDGEYIIILANA